MQSAGEIRFETEECCVIVSKVGERRVLVVFEGKDRGELGREPFDAIEKSFQNDTPLDLFFDLFSAEGATLEVSGPWALWLRANRARLGRVTMLTGSPFVKLSARSVQRFSGLGDKLRLYSDPQAFASELDAPRHPE
jgi:hypothetical protein